RARRHRHRDLLRTLRRDRRPDPDRRPRTARLVDPAQLRARPARRRLLPAHGQLRGAAACRRHRVRPAPHVLTPARFPSGLPTPPLPATFRGRTARAHTPTVRPSRLSGCPAAGRPADPPKGGSSPIRQRLRPPRETPVGTPGRPADPPPDDGSYWVRAPARVICTPSSCTVTRRYRTTSGARYGFLSD